MTVSLTRPRRFISDLKHDPVLKDVPLTGVGGIETWRDCLEFLMLGAENLQVTTAVMQYGYRIVEDMISGLCARVRFSFTHMPDPAAPGVSPSREIVG